MYFLGVSNKDTKSDVSQNPNVSRSVSFLLRNFPIYSDVTITHEVYIYIGKLLQTAYIIY